MSAVQTPATRAAEAAGIPFSVHEYAHDPGAKAYGLEAAEAMGVEPGRVFKTLVVSVPDDLIVCLVPVAETLRLRTLGKHAAMAAPARAERATGYVTGGISPLGQRRPLATFIDESALGHETVFVSAGRRGLELELAPGDLVALTDAMVRSLT